MIEVITILLIGAYLRVYAFDPFVIVAIALFCAHMLARFVRAVIEYHHNRGKAT